jgi:hypothetical protein
MTVPLNPSGDPEVVTSVPTTANPGVVTTPAGLGVAVVGRWQPRLWAFHGSFL